MTASRGPILTLEPLIDAVRDGVESAGWELSGLQKTTSHQFEGRWAGDETRSAYLFFHRPGTEDEVSVDVYLDETSRGLKGNLALVLEGRELGVTGSAPELLEALGRVAAATLPEGYRTPVSARYRLPDGNAGTDETDLEIRFKLRIPTAAVEAGPSAVSALASAVVGAFEELLATDEVERWAWTD